MNFFLKGWDQSFSSRPFDMGAWTAFRSETPSSSIMMTSGECWEKVTVLFRVFLIIKAQSIISLFRLNNLWMLYKCSLSGKYSNWKFLGRNWNALRAKELKMWRYTPNNTLQAALAWPGYIHIITLNIKIKRTAPLTFLLYSFNFSQNSLLFVRILLSGLEGPKSKYLIKSKAETWS